MHLSPFYPRMHREWLRYAKSTSQFHWRFLLVRDVRGFQVNPLCRHDITSPFPPSGNGGYVRNLDVFNTLYSIITESLKQQNTFTKLKKGVQKTKAYCNIAVKVNISSTTVQIVPLKHHLYKKLSKSFIIL